ncbi:MAG: phenylacetate-CoA oxygenase subunit PaaJ [Actinobacteria bacterium]|nr:MAG: phenylacetate-CoA oxygenase subunit PaaJ [Actinomycetota bacterium]
MVSEAQVWEALAEIPDPEIPFTPTFLGCPALEVMQRAMTERIEALGAEADVHVVTDDSWSTDKITPAGREKLRASGFAPPAPRSAGTATTLVELNSMAFRCPYCGSKETALENLFGPTPCRSVRYCNACRQPFEQFKTI